GQPVDPQHGKRGKQRSVHNTYFTLPVLFAMLSNHYSFTYSHPQNWLVLMLMMFAGAAIRQFFVMRHGYKLGRNPHPWKYAAVGLIAIAAVLVWLRPVPQTARAEAASTPATQGAASAAGGPVSYKTLQPILAQRCYMCHAEQVQMKNVRLDSPEAVAKNAQMIYQQVVVSRLMPINNATGIGEAERGLIKLWFESGAHVD
ncbi:MAG: urate hydroxylase PuuD, partial [Rhodoferax sp.]|nr:urate hydroxylase PuuD [Rhodoferax sp.]